MKKLLQTTGLIFAMLLLANVGMAQTFSPTNEATGVSTSPMLTITFDDNVELVKGKSIYVINSDLSEIYDFSTGKIMPPKNADNELVVLGNTLTIDLTGKVLNESTEFSVFADAGAIKVGGVDWDDLNDPTYTNSIWSFITEAPSVPISYFFTPENEASDVSTSPELIITFNANVELIKGKSIYVVNSDLTKIYDFSTGKIMPPISADDELVVIGTTLTIDLTGVVLSASTEFSVFADAGAIKVGGVEWDGLNDPTFTNSIWSFTTDAAPAGPTIDFFTPSDGSIDVSVNPTLTLTIDFDRPIAFGSGGSFRLKSNAGDVSFSTSNPNISISGNTLTINATGLTYSTLYQVEIDPGFIENYSGLSAPNYWTFTTETAPPKWAVNYPTLTQSSTGFTFKGKSDLAGTYYYVVTAYNTRPSYAQIKAGKDHLGQDALHAGNESMTANDEFSKTVLFDDKLAEGTSYYLHIVATSSNDKNSGIDLPLTIDRTAPFVINGLSNPSDGYRLFKINKSILIVFSEKVYDYNGNIISPLSLASFSLKTGEESVPVDFSVSANGKEVTLTPQESLLEDAEYIVEINSLSDAYYNVMNTVTRTFQTDKLNVWTGAVSTSWTEAGNWQNNSYVAGKSVRINAGSAPYPEINTDITVNNFTIEAGAVVTQTKGIITVSGDFDLLSSVDKNASYLPKGGSLDVKGETRVHQHIVPDLGLNVVYVMGTPTLGATNDNVGTEYRIKKYDNPTDSWLKINSDLMEPGVGYSIYAENDLIFRGAINRVATTHDLKRTNGKGYGWNVMGNPFTAGMKWSELDIPLTVENSYWIWTPQDKIYGAFNEEVGIGVGGLDGTIPSNHGFLVKLKIGKTTGSITFDPKAMVVNNDNYLKSTSKSKPHMKISAGRGNSKDQLAIAFVSDATQGIDKYDTEKFFGSGTLEVFSVEGTSKLSINSLPDTNEETTVGLGYKASEAGTYTIELSDNYLDHYEVVLTDTKKGTSVDLLHDGSYTFTVDGKETNTSRFTLTFPARIPTSVNKVVSSIGNMKIYLKDGDVMVQIIDATESMTYELVGISGNMIGRGSLHSGVNNLGKFPSGLYIINTRNGEGTILSKKLLVTR